MNLFNISQIPTEVLDCSFRRYEPFNLTITHRHPLRKTNTKTVDFEFAKSTICNTYPIYNEQIVFDNKLFYILISHIENNPEIISNAMNTLGFTIDTTFKKHLTDWQNREWCILLFLPFNKLCEMSTDELIIRQEK